MDWVTLIAGAAAGMMAAVVAMAIFTEHGGTRMKSAAEIRNLIANWKVLGLTAVEIVVNAAFACLDETYVWGATGQECTPEKRRYFAGRSACPEDESKLILAQCQVCRASNPKGSCDGCAYFPGGARTFIFDCQGFVKWLFKQVGITLQGGGCTTMWGNAANWSQKGELKDMPPEAVCLVFMYSSKTGKMEHVGLHIGGGRIIHCSGKVKEGKTTDRGWTHYAMVKGFGGDTPVPVPTTKPTLRRGSTGEYVVECQNDLIQLGYDLTPYGADGKFGRKTEEAVKAFQREHVGPDGAPLKADGIVGQATWWALDNAVGPQPTPTTLYTVTIPHLTAEQADSLVSQYAGASKTEEGR